MKKLLGLSMILLSAMLFVYGCGSAKTLAEKEQRAVEVRNAMEMSDFTFKATYAYPTGFKSRYLSPYYDVVVSQDTVKVYLPYYGRAYRAPIDPRDGGYRFTSTDFSYNVVQGKRGNNWLVDISFNDLDRAVEFHFDIFENGTGRLSVNDTDRQGISYQGEIHIE